MQQPGSLLDLDAAGADAWADRVRGLFATVAGTAEGSRFVFPTLEAKGTAVTATDWTAFPVRVANCLTRERALRLLDAPGETVGGGGRRLQEEYAEWRVGRSDGVIDRVELTTELPDYWRILAAHEPARLLELVTEFAGDSVPTKEVYGSCNPFGRRVSPEDRELAFAQTMLGNGHSPYNDGRHAICCLAQDTNELEDLFALAIEAANCRVIRDADGGQMRCLTCFEAIPLLGQAAQLGRGSDPVLVERLGRLAYEGCQVAFEDPIGIYIVGVEHARLRTPSGEVVPAEWFRCSRGTSADESPDGQARHQRLTFEVPAEEGFSVGNLVDVATEQPIRHGGQIADLVSIVVRLRVTGPDVVEVDRASETDLAEEAEDSEGCAEIRAREHELIGLI